MATSDILKCMKIMSIYTKWHTIITKISSTLPKRGLKVDTLLKIKRLKMKHLHGYSSQTSSLLLLWWTCGELWLDPCVNSGWTEIKMQIKLSENCFWEGRAQSDATLTFNVWYFLVKVLIQYIENPVVFVDLSSFILRKKTVSSMIRRKIKAVCINKVFSKFFLSLSVFLSWSFVPFSADICFRSACR